MLNQCILTGNLGADPESFFTAEGMQITTFNIAFRSGKDRTGWIKVASFNKLAELVEKYLHKGAKVAVMATLDQKKWEAEDGSKKSTFQLLANSIEFIKTDGRGFENGNQTNGEEDVPF
jgi:single-strand DNA-binding protein